MTETISEYNKTITFTDLDEYITKTFSLPKIFRDSHKPDPLTESMEDLKDMFREETSEMLKAYRIWESNRTEKNADAFLEEIADVKNIANFMGGKVAGFHRMERK